jgi:quercetin dioxygenase-like cupin family protein
MTRPTPQGDGFLTHGTSAAFSKPLTEAGVAFDVQLWTSTGRSLTSDATHYGFVQSGTCELQGPAGTFPLSQGMYFALPGRGEIRGKGTGLLISQHGPTGLFQIGGPIESRGRLQYIDGCSDTLLIAPAVLGEPCLNLLVIPPGTCQTAHTHPSFRAGMIARGRGLCRLRDRDVPLAAGDLFVIEADVLHSFHTQDDSLTVIAFHPDSDYGPHRDNHPMVNRTMVDGVSASQLSLAERRLEGAPR